MFPDSYIAQSFFCGDNTDQMAAKMAENVGKMCTYITI